MASDARDRQIAAMRTRDRLTWTVLGVSAIVALLTFAATRYFAPTPPPRGAGPMFPRMRVPATATTGDLLRSMGVGSLTWYASILAAPLFVWLGRRLPLERRRWALSVGVHVVAIVALVCIAAAAQHALTYAGAPQAPPLSYFLRAALLTGMLPFVTVAVAAQALVARSRAQERELEAARAHGQLAEARLEALTAQLQPHFLFNTLQGISALISRDPIAADRMLTSLSDLLREVLRAKDRREVPLDEELRVLAPYLDISRWRFGDRLTIRIDVDDAVREACVPFFVLQPLVENALHHGVGSRAGAATIAIAAEREGERLWLTVLDDGVGAAESNGRRGIGLPNTQARLQELYGDAHLLELGPVVDGGFRARVGIPFRRCAT